MSKIKGFILYRFYYKEKIVYIGRTKQPLQNRIRGHLFKLPMHRSIDINLVTKIEYAEFKTESDMNLYEIYYINLLKPSLNIDDKCRDELTIRLPDAIWINYKCHLWEKWKTEINDKTSEYKKKREKYNGIHEEYSIIRNMYKMKEITKEEYEGILDKIRNEEEQLKKYLYR